MNPTVTNWETTHSQTPVHLHKKKNSTQNYFLIGFLVRPLKIGFLAYRNFRNRQQLARQQAELQQQRIRELEKDKQLVAVDSMLQGQEEERSRLAKDLHDGLGGLLSGVKFSLSNMIDNLIITPDNIDFLERALKYMNTRIIFCMGNSQYMIHPGLQAGHIM